MRPVPSELHGRPFTAADAALFAVTARMLQGKRYVELVGGVYRTAETEPTLDLYLRAGLRVLPGDVAVSHVTNLRLRGLPLGPLLPLHFSTNHPHQIVRRGVQVHRRLGPMQRTMLQGHPALGPRRTFIDLATQLDDRRLLQVGDWMVADGHVDLSALREHVEESHLDGVVRSRRVAKHVAEGVASPRESDLRWTLHRGGIPLPEVNVDILDDHGQWLARGDLVFRRWKVLVEYDGWQHERDAWQRQRDHLRREALEAAGWRVIVVTTADMAAPRSTVARVRQALRQRGCPC